MSYHINPETKRPNICRKAAGECAIAEEHFETAEEAKSSLIEVKSASEPEVEVPVAETEPEAVKDTPAEEKDPGFSDAIMDTLRLGLTGDYEELERKREISLQDRIEAFGKATGETFNEAAEKVKDAAEDTANDPRVKKFTEGTKEAAAKGFKTVGDLSAKGIAGIKGLFKK